MQHLKGRGVLLVIQESYRSEVARLPTQWCGKSIQAREAVSQWWNAGMET